jgi:hypothetical protein
LKHITAGMPLDMPYWGRVLIGVGLF